jgi:hypothetical protein
LRLDRRLTPDRPSKDRDAMMSQPALQDLSYQVERPGLDDTGTNRLAASNTDVYDALEGKSMFERDLPIDANDPRGRCSVETPEIWRRRVIAREGGVAQDVKQAFEPAVGGQYLADTG